MQIKAIQFRKDGFYTQPFVFGGEEGTDKFDKNVRYRGSLQNYLIDTGDEVILVDTGLPAGTPEEVPDETRAAFTGKDICSYMEAFAALGYKPEQVTKILLTHRHSDHSGELRSFPAAKIYVNAEELDAANKSVKTASDAATLIADTLRKIEKEPKNVNYYLALVNLYLQQKQYDEALAAIDKCRAVVGQDPQLDLRYAAVKTEKYDTDIAALREAGQNEQADALQAERDQYVFDDIAERVQRYPNDQHLRFQLGEQYWKYGYPDEAIQQFQISQKSPKDRVMSLYLMAQCFQQKGMLDMAVEQLSGALEQLPTMDRQKMDVFYLLGEISEQEGKLDEASKYFKEIYRADVTYKDVADRVQRIYAAQKAAAEAGQGQGAQG